MAANVLFRTAIFVLGVVAVLGGFGLMAARFIGEGLWLVVAGSVLLLVAVLERNRYRSEAAERSQDPPGPGGGETAGAVDVRFRPTDEVFVDPTTQRRMRVLLDSRTGERRYVAED